MACDQDDLEVTTRVRFAWHVSIEHCYGCMRGGSVTVNRAVYINADLGESDVTRAERNTIKIRVGVAIREWKACVEKR